MQKHLILTGEQVEKLGVDLNNLELIITDQQTEMMGVEKERMRQIRANMSVKGADLAIITNTSCYGGMMVNKYSEEYSLYKFK